eukprot:s243_g3.t2
MKCFQCCRLCTKSSTKDSGIDSETESESSIIDEVREEIENHQQTWDSLYFPIDVLCGTSGTAVSEEEEVDLEVLLGTWKCVDTWGLDEFLKTNGVGMLQRKLAASAKWPNWDFIRTERGIRFVNHSMLGDLVEDIDLTEEYASKDGQGNLAKCRAEWLTVRDGGMLRTRKMGDLGDWIEERKVTDDRLEFVLTQQKNGSKWGRSFVRLEAPG